MGKFINESRAFKGKVGDMHGSSNNGKPYVKGPYKKRTKKAKGKEKQNQDKFAAASAWLSPTLVYVRQGFNGFNFKENSQGYGAAKSYVLQNAFEGVAPNLIINPALVKVSYGSLDLADNMTVVKSAEHELKFAWDNVWTEQMGYYDQAMLLAYDVQNGRASMLITGQFRHTGESLLHVDYPNGNGYLPKGGTFHCYLAFVAADRSRQSDSVYLGEVTF